MPRSAFTSQMLNSAGGGLSRLAMALGGAGSARQNAYDSEIERQAKMASAMANIERDQAAADKYSADAEDTRAKTGVLNRRPEMFPELVAAKAGTSIPLVEAVRNSMRTGQPAAGNVMGPPAEDGRLGVGQVDQPTQSRIMRALQELAPVLINSGDINPAQMAQAAETYRGMGLSDDIISGGLDRNRVAGAQAAAVGKALYNADGTGAVLDLFGGGLDINNPMAQGTIGLRGAQAAQAKAAATENYAQADNARASAARTRAAIAEDGRAAGRAPSGYRWKADGGLEPIPGGPADPGAGGAKNVKPPTEGQAKALLFGSRMAVADEILRELQTQGHKMPNLIKQGVEKVPLVGGLLGMGANAFSSQEQQQIEQAQRDFINAVLRRESGATIMDSEFANAQRQYFPQPNDDAQTLAQKNANRRVAIEGMKAEFGDAGLPKFLEIVRGARSTRQQGKKPAAAPVQQGASVPAGGGGWKIERIE